MASDTKRKLVAIAFMGVGAFVVVQGHTDEAAIFYAIAIVYWAISGLWARLNVSRPRAKPSPRPRQESAPAPAHVEIAAHAARAGRSDGAAGAAARLDPAWRDWLRREAGSHEPSR